jgi:membrane protein required for colicin V production
MFISGLDLILFVVAILSGLLAMVRGMTREVLSIASWVAAAFAALYAFNSYREFARAQIEPDALADIALVAGTFLIVLILVSFITMKISDFILDSRVGAIDRTLGFAFGAFRGLVLVVVGYLFFSWLVPVQSQPDWVRTARSLPLIQSTGNVLINLLPEDPESAILDRFRSEFDLDDAPTPDGADADGGTGGGIDGLIENEGNTN